MATESEVDIAGDKGSLGAIAIEELDIRDQFLQLHLCLIKLGGILGINIKAKRQQRHADDHARIVQEDHLAVSFQQHAHSLAVVVNPVVPLPLDNLYFLKAIDGSDEIAYFADLLFISRPGCV